MNYALHVLRRDEKQLIDEFGRVSKTSTRNFESPELAIVLQEIKNRLKVLEKAIQLIEKHEELVSLL